MRGGGEGDLTYIILHCTLCTCTLHVVVARQFNCLLEIWGFELCKHYDVHHVYTCKYTLQLCMHYTMYLCKRSDIGFLHMAVDYRNERDI